jgi:hypothetical protein
MRYSLTQAYRRLRRRRTTPAPRAPYRRPQLETLESRELLSAALAPPPASGTWTALTNPAPDGAGTMMLLSDGTVMVQGGGTTAAWQKLTPDGTGSYANGSWSQLAPMGTPRLYFASNVLTSGKVLVLGGEYTDAGSVWTNTGEIYDPVANTWTPISPFPQSNFGDDPSEVLPDGTVLLGYLSGPQTYIYNPANDTYTPTTGAKLRNDRSDEETWVKLPDGSVLSYDIFSSIGTGTNTAQRYDPTQGQWVDAGTLPVALSSSGVGYEMGPALLLPDGRVLEVGAQGNTALYTPSTNSWAAGPTLPAGMGADDAPGAMLPNGHVMFAADTTLFTAPTLLGDFNPATGKLSQVPVPAGLQSDLQSNPAYVMRMLDLPNGQLLLEDGTSQLWVFTPPGGPQKAWRPVIQSVTYSGNFVWTLTGTQLNGLSEGASYGDDAEMSSNYPIVQLTDSSGGVHYARSYNWSLTGVATGSQVETVNFTLPAGLAPGSYTLRVIANGIASSGKTGTITASEIPPGGLAPSFLATSPTGADRLTNPGSPSFDDHQGPSAVNPPAFSAQQLLAALLPAVLGKVETAIAAPAGSATTAGAPVSVFSPFTADLTYRTLAALLAAPSVSGHTHKQADDVFTGEEV